MKQKLGILLAVGGLFVLVVGGLNIAGGRAPKQGVLKVNSNPSASLFLSERHLGRTPYEEKADAGDYSIKIVPETTITSLATWQGTIRIFPGILTYINANVSESEFTSAVDILWLEKISSKVSEIAVTTNPDGASVALDGDMKGISPVSLPTVSPGEHTLTITSPGFATRSVRVKTTAGYKVNSIIKLALSPGSESQPEASPTSVPTGTLTPTPTKKSASTANPPTPYAVIKDTPTGFLRVRLEATTAASEAGRVNPGDKFSILDTGEDTKGNTWYQIKYDGKNLGWISGQYAEKVE